MLRVLRNRMARRLAGVEFCDRCAAVCDPGCRSRAVRGSQRDRVLTGGFLSVR